MYVIYIQICVYIHTAYSYPTKTQQTYYIHPRFHPQNPPPMPQKQSTSEPQDGLRAGYFVRIHLQWLHRSASGIPGVKPVEVGRIFSHYFYPLWIHGTGPVYLPTWMLDFYGFHVGKYTVRPMDPMGYTGFDTSLEDSQRLEFDKIMEVWKLGSNDFPFQLGDC